MSENISFKVWPEITKTDEEFVIASLRQSNHSMGHNCKMLQEEWSQWNGNKYCIATNSGTSALHMCIAACGIGPGDEVITTTTSWTSSATCILHHNAIPVFTEIDMDTMLIDPYKIEACINEKTKAILVVHYWGLPCDMEPILEIAEKYKLFIIEDACQAHGSMYKGKKSGTLGHCAAFSLNQNKNLTAGEGGLFVTDDTKVFEAACALMEFNKMGVCNKKLDDYKPAMGWMYRPNDMTAALARSQLCRLDETNRIARHNWDRLNNDLKELKKIICPISNEKQTTNGYAYVFRVIPEQINPKFSESKVRDWVVRALLMERVPVSRVNWVLPSHTVIQMKNAYGQGCPWSCHLARKDICYDLNQYPITKRVSNTSIQIGINGHRPPNGDQEIDAIICGIKKVLENSDQIPIKG